MKSHHGIAKFGNDPQLHRRPEPESANNNPPKKKIVMSTSSRMNGVHREAVNVQLRALAVSALGTSAARDLLAFDRSLRLSGSVIGGPWGSSSKLRANSWPFRQPNEKGEEQCVWDFLSDC
jgi:hypothetical protein